MKEKVYIMTMEAAGQTGARDELLSLGATIAIANATDRLPERFYDALRVVVLIAPDDATVRIPKFRFPSKHLRILPSLEKARGEGLFVPKLYDSYLQGRCATVIALHAGSRQTHGLRDALRSFHWRDPRTGAWLGQKRKKKSRLARLAERRRERREQYALP